jgi:hypothetical protein
VLWGRSNVCAWADQRPGGLTARRAAASGTNLYVHVGSAVLLRPLTARARPIRVLLDGASTRPAVHS